MCWTRACFVYKRSRFDSEWRLQGNQRNRKALVSNLAANGPVSDPCVMPRKRYGSALSLYLSGAGSTPARGSMGQ